MSIGTRVHRRRSTRLRARDYSSPGHYFITLCAQDRKPIFGDVVDGVMHLNDAGRAADSFWREIPEHFPHAELDEYAIMPNHIHGIIRISDAARMNGGNVGANNYSPLRDFNTAIRFHELSLSRPRGTSRTIGSMVRGFKIGVTQWMRSGGHIGPVWQRNFHDHIIRNERSLERIRAYIRNNPANWWRDRNNPNRLL